VSAGHPGPRPEDLATGGRRGQGKPARIDTMDQAWQLADAHPETPLTKAGLDDLRTSDRRRQLRPGA
jgi:hypothetical protein